MQKLDMVLESQALQVVAGAGQGLLGQVCGDDVPGSTASEHGGEDACAHPDVKCGVR